MLSIRILFSFLFLHSVNNHLQINLYLTDWASNDENNNDLQHDCLYVIAPNLRLNNVGQVILYCMNEWPSKWNIQKNNFDPKFTFAELTKRNVSSQQLYFWSAPMDVIENYQFYLNQLPNSEKTSMAAQLFYNCTLPNFGPKCQYVLYDHKFYHTSLYEIVHDYYCWNRYEPTTLTCYTHLQCNRGLPPSCLDWTEICDGKVDCLDNEHDEEHCWQIEIHECNENEYRCVNGQCIPLEFSKDLDLVFDCLDRSDEDDYWAYLRDDQSSNRCPMPEPTISNEDTTCIKTPNSRSLIYHASSCSPQRHHLLLQAMFSVKPKSISNECWTAFKCIIGMPILEDSICRDLCSNGTCDEIIRNTCPDIISAPAVPLLFGRIYLAYEKDNLIYRSYSVSKPIYICYNGQLLHLPNASEIWPLSNNDTCRLYNNLIPSETIIESRWLGTYIEPLFKWVQTWSSWIYNDSINCNKSIMYQCINSYQCISKNRLFDNFQDCYYIDDEDMSMWDKSCLIERDFKYFKCETTNECIPFRFEKDSKCDCIAPKIWDCDDEVDQINYDKTKIIFPRICDNFTLLTPIIIDGQNHTDETECNQWPCNNIYTRCNDFWNCLNGVDELNCDPSPLLNCPSNNHICVSIETKKLMCLPIEKANDGNIDCIGAADEPTLCRANKDGNIYQTLYCKNHYSLPCLDVRRLCNGQSDCINNEDEQSCTPDDFNKSHILYSICGGIYELDVSDIAKTLCKLFYPYRRRYDTRSMILDVMQNLFKQDIPHISSDIFPDQSIIQNVQHYQQRCHRGLNLQVWLDEEKNLTTSTCLCPPSFYGDICQFQNQRVSVTIAVRVTFDSVQKLFVIIVSLIDNSDERIIHSYEQFTYLSKIHCDTKFHVYLLYSARPKNLTKDYSVHIDIYEKDPLNYRGSVIQPLLFPFLPIQRLSFILNILHIDENIDSCSDLQCIHGKCRRYSNDPNNTIFCHCNSGWFGRYCTIQHTCMCSSDSLCIGMLANNRSLCVCPLNRMGHRCLLNNSICQINPCLHGGKCIATEEYRPVDKQFICICQKGYDGDRCEINQTKIIVSFDKDVTLPTSISIHFIRVVPYESIERGSTIKTIPFGQDSITIYWTFLFHIVFIEWNDNYYLLVLQKQYKQSAIIEKTLHSTDRCLNIDELFNETIVNYHILRRIKYYHVPCRTTTSSQLSCFYDDIHLCICQDHAGERVANCFEFDHNMSRNCSGKSNCENGGECFQDNLQCPATAFCKCPICFYGTRCQVSTSGFSLSLDSILGYHIRPNVNISRQPTAVLISLILSVIISSIGMINGVVSLITFKHKKARDFGCGIYLLCSSINTLLTIIIFTLKIWILVFSQMGSIKNRSFLNIQCHSIDFLLRFCLLIDQWLTTFVAIERAYITIKGVNCNKRKIRLTAKFVITGLILIILVTTIHDSIYRRLFDEEIIDEEKRIWCIVDYSPTIRIINLVITIFHIIVPFIINIISAMIIIIINARQRAAVQKQKKYKNVLNEQFQQHKNLLIGPVVLIIVAIPRLIISFASGCMKSASDSWLFLLGYFISLIPPLLTFILFVLPSSTYYEIFHKVVSRYRNMIRMRY